MSAGANVGWNRNGGWSVSGYAAQTYDYKEYAEGVRQEKEAYDLNMALDGNSRQRYIEPGTEAAGGGIDNSGYYARGYEGATGDRFNGMVFGGMYGEPATIADAEFIRPEDKIQSSIMISGTISMDDQDSINNIVWQRSIKALAAMKRGELYYEKASQNAQKGDRINNPSYNENVFAIVKGANEDNYKTIIDAAMATANEKNMDVIIYKNGMMKNYNEIMKQADTIANEFNCVVIVVPTETWGFTLGFLPNDIVSSGAYAAPKKVELDSSAGKDINILVNVLEYINLQQQNKEYKVNNIVLVTTSQGALITSQAAWVLKDKGIMLNETISLQTLGGAAFQFHDIWKKESHEVFLNDVIANTFGKGLIPDANTHFYDNPKSFPDSHNIENGYIYIINKNLGAK